MRLVAILCGFALLALCGCRNALAPASGVALRSDILAPGVVHVSVPLDNGSGIDIVDVDLARSTYRPSVLTRNVSINGGKLLGDAYTPADWLAKSGALAVVNGGYFGAGPDNRKPIVGLFVAAGKTLQQARPIHGNGGSLVEAGNYVRSAFGVQQRDGLPMIEWSATPSRGGSKVYAYAQPVDPVSGVRWHVDDAVGCGPTLIRAGKPVVTDHQERLVDDLPTARTFVAYDSAYGRPLHFVMGIGDNLTYSQVANALVHYYRVAHRSTVARAMCLDGGSSSQLTYTVKANPVSPRATMVTVPDAIALVETHGDLLPRNQ